VGRAARSEITAPLGFTGSPRLAWRGPHSWHQSERVWSTTNSHLDVWIELLNTLDLDPKPLLLPTLCASFEGDQWTHARITPADLWSCYGIVVEELFVWRQLLAHFVEQLDRGNAILVEVDAFHLPDMVGGSYQREHAKTLIAVTGYDRHSHRLRYLHGAAGAEVGGDDLDALITAGIGSAQLAPFAQIVKLDRLVPRTEADLVHLGVALARFHATRLPQHNPVKEFGDALRQHGAWLSGGDAEQYQRWAFATLQQCGASFEIAADVCAWLSAHGEPVSDAVAPMRLLATSARVLHQRLVRVSQSGRMPNVSQTVEEMSRAWDEAMAVIRPLYAA
jgi:hypothetical protein